MGELADPAAEELTRITKAVTRALEEVQALHDSIGPLGRQPTRVNRFGETALELDVQAEAIVLSALRRAHLPIRVIAEEHGDVSIDPRPRYLGFLDGLDGSNRYLAGPGTERYGTMLAVYLGADPTFGEYLVSAIQLLATRERLIATRGRGAWLEGAAIRRPLRTATAPPAERLRAHLDKSVQGALAYFGRRAPDMALSDPRAYAAYFADLLLGHVDCILAVTRKQNLEPIIAFGLLHEAGAVMVDAAGDSLGPLRCGQFGSQTAAPFIAASNGGLAAALANSFTRS